ncbi:putative zinc finger protein 735 [Littorina saxatilis]|uniref:putative zinc finger protein 735 n=1 Tax=Littorina saxatilis TaxID=31220 RepID=UPI0038B637E8
MAFDTRKWLAVHALKHNGERPHLCPECGKSFTEAQVLQRHRLAMHQAARPYGCLQCSKTFKTSSALAYHQRSHVAAKPYLCDECGKTFPCARALSTHKMRCKALGQPNDQGNEQERVEVNGSDEIPGSVVNVDSDRQAFKCQDCGAAFKGEQWLYRHQGGVSAPTSGKAQLCISSVTGSHGHMLVTSVLLPLETRQAV